MITLIQKHIAILVLVTVFVLFFTGQIDPNLTEYEGSDLNKYIEMATSAPELNQDIIKPFVYRIFVPWVAGIMPFAIHTNFFILNLVSLFTLSLIFYFLLIDFNISPVVSLILTIAFQMNKYFFQFLSWNYFQVCDTLSLVILFSSFLLIKRKKWLLLFMLMPFSILIKEYILLIIPYGVFNYFYIKSSKKDQAKFAIISLTTIIVFVLVRIFIEANEGVDLLTQYLTQEFYYSGVMLFLKKYIASFTPFGLIPIVFYKELLLFFKKNMTFLVYTLTVILVSYFGEAERMMAPIAPVYYLFIGNLIEEKFKVEKKESSKYKFIIIVVTICFLSSFYHLWGVVQLPNKYYSMVISIVSSILILFVFYSKGKNINHIPKNSI